MATRATVLFVHGTGVREGPHLLTFKDIQAAFTNGPIDHDVHACPWGDVLGARPIVHSLPDTTRTPKTAALTHDEEQARWEILARDPLFELRLLRNRPREPGRRPAGGDLWDQISDYKLRDAALTIVRDADLESCWADAWTLIIDDTTRDTVQKAGEIGEPAEAVARAVVAAMLAYAFDQELPLLGSLQRDALIDALVDHWGGRVAGKGTWLLQWFTTTAGAMATPILKRFRGPLAELANPEIGDILRYLARPVPIQDHLRRAIESTPGDDVYLLGHSLGGIVCVDLLATTALPRVKGLITVGSQAPYLHEIGALHGLEPGTTDLPAHFPDWLNLYDPYDFLSYVAEPVFARGVKDCRIESGQPFPYSHSAYWGMADTWTAIKAFLP